jgi:ubiquinone/menaquinone biosynthesis C-methylase UbiE
MAFLTPASLVNTLALRSGASVADIGSGSGAYLAHLARAVGEEGKVYAVDIHKDALVSTKKALNEMGYQNIDIIWSDIEEGLYLDSYSLDSVVLSNTLFMLENKEAAIKEIKRVLIPEGLVLVVEWSQSHNGIGPHKDHVVREVEAENLFISSGFRIVKRLPAGHFHYAFLAKSL